MRSFRLAESFDADLVCSLRDGTGASTVIDDRMTPDLWPRAAWMPLPAEAEFAPVEKQQQSGRDPFPARRWRLFHGDARGHSPSILTDHPRTASAACQPACAKTIGHSLEGDLS
jgi:hypothetical protein